MKSIEPFTLVLLAVALIAVLAVLVFDLKQRSGNRSALERFALEGRSVAALQMLTAALVLAGFFGAVPVQLTLLLAGGLWAGALAVGQFMAVCAVVAKPRRLTS